MEMTDVQWAVAGREVTARAPGKDPRGRKPRDPRAVLEGVLWILRTGARWKDPPPQYPPYQTCHRRFQAWVKEGRLEQVVRALAQDLVDRGGIDLSEAYIDGTFVSAKRGALALVQQSAAKGARSWQSRTAMVFLSPF